MKWPLQTCERDLRLFEMGARGYGLELHAVPSWLGTLD